MKLFSTHYFSVLSVLDCESLIKVAYNKKQVTKGRENVKRNDEELN